MDNKKKPVNNFLDDLMIEPMDQPIRYLITASRIDYSFILQYVKGKRKENKATLARIRQARKI